MSDVETPPKRSKKSVFNDDFEDEQIEPPSFSPASLGLHRVGTVLPPRPQPSLPIQTLNARGMPARIRKRNRLFFDDELINDSKSLRASLSPRKMSKPNSPVRTPIKDPKKRKALVARYSKSDEKEKIIVNTTKPVTTIAQIEQRVQSADQQMAQRIGMRLRNVLKLPKAHKWTIYEWFYSFIDRPLFEGDNDFQVCLKENFPHLKTRTLTRAEWRMVRSKMGKPRRCSAAFFEEERRELERKRQKIRLLQARKSGDMNFVKDLPEKIPLPLPVGTKVTAHIKKPLDGLFTGSVDAYDSLTSTYRVTLDRADLGTLSIQDYDISSNDFYEMLPISSVTQEFRPRLGYNGNSMSSPMRNRSILNKSDPLLGQDIFDSPFTNPVSERETIGGFPIKLLESITRLKKTISIKKSKLYRLKELNEEAERKKAYNDTLSEDFQRRYASIIISMEKMNRDIQSHLEIIQSFVPDLTRDPQIQAMLVPSYLRENCREAAVETVERNNSTTMKDKSMMELITDLTTVLHVASNLSPTESNAHVGKVLDGCIEEVKCRLTNNENIEVFQKQVLIHLHHIRLGIGQPGMNGISRNSIGCVD